MPRSAPLLVLLLSLLSAPGARAEDRSRLKDVQALEEAMTQIIEKAEPSVACVLVSRSDAYANYNAAPSPDTPGKLGKFDATRWLSGFTGDSRTMKEEKKEKIKEIVALDLSHPDHQPEAYGSGVVLDAAGLVLTNAHVVRGATKVYVRLPGNRGSYADIHALDPRSDLAVLKLLDKVPDLKPLKFGDGGKLRKGQFVLSLANPFAAGFRDGSPSASWGIVSNLRRRAPGGQTSELDRTKPTLHHYGTLIQTDTRVVVGCSGGALVNLDGELVGMITAQAALVGSEAPGGFAIPFDDGLKRIVEVLRRGEEVEYGFLGVQMDQNARPARGVKIDHAVPGSPARKAGLAAGDIILTIGGHPVQDIDDLFLFIGTQLAGNSVNLEVDGGGGKRSVTVKLAKFYVPGSVIASKQTPARAGLRVDFTSIIPQRGPIFGGYKDIPDGVVIRDVVANSPAAEARLQPDKVITHVNRKAVHSPEEFYQAMDAAGGKIELTVIGSDGREEEYKLTGK
jgi:S1-C subfamily serine protease